MTTRSGGDDEGEGACGVGQRAHRLATGSFALQYARPPSRSASASAASSASAELSSRPAALRLVRTSSAICWRSASLERVGRPPDAEATKMAPNHSRAQARRAPERRSSLSAERRLG